jgi:hypothetical protein
MHRFHRYDNVVAGETDRASSGITVTVFPGELRGVAVDLTRSGGIRGSAVPIGIGGIEGNIERVPTLMNAELKHALPVQKFLVNELAVKLCRSAVSVVPIVAGRITADLQSQLCIKTCDFIQSG